MKRKTALFLTLTAMIASAVPTAAANWRDTKLSNGFEVEYNTETNEIRAKGSISKSSDTAVASTTKFTKLEIPEKVDGMTVKAIGERAFMDYDEFNAVTFPSTITKIGTRAFWGADSFSKITLPDGVTEIGESAFESCDSLAGISLGKSLSVIGTRAFKNCKAISTMNLPDTVTSIGTGAFENCKGITTLKLSKNLTDLGDGAFKGCEGLKSVTLPEGITVLKSNTFDSCTNLESVTLPSGLKTIDNAVFGNCKALKKVYVPATVKTISKTAFDGCPDVTIYCKNGSYAQQFALEKKFPVITGEEIVTDETVPDHITVIVNDEEVNFKNAQPVIVNGRTLVPMRDIFETLGLVVYWDAETKTVTGKKGVTDVSLTIGESKVYLNGKPQAIDVPAQIIDGSTMVPLRVISDSVGCRITWDQNTKTANIVG